MPKSADQLKARDLAGGYFFCPNANYSGGGSPFKENNIQSAAEAAALAAQRAAATDAGGFMDLLPPAVKMRRRVRLGLPARSATESPTASNDIAPKFYNSPLVEDT